MKEQPPDIVNKLPETDGDPGHANDNDGHRTGRLLKKLFFIGGDLLIALGAFVLADMLYNDLHDTFDGIFIRSYMGNTHLMWLLAGVLAIPIFSVFGFYRQLWRYASIPQYLSLAFGTFIYTAILMIAANLTDIELKTAYYIVFWMVLLFLVTGYRLFFRLMVNRQTLLSVLSYSQPVRTHYRSGNGHGKPKKEVRVLVIGAGYAGNQIIREMIEVGSDRVPVALIDDDPRKHNLSIYNVPVVGGRNQIESAVSRYAVEEIILAIPSASRQVIRELVDVCKRTSCALRILPILSDIINGKVSIADIKEVEIEDLLGRDEVMLNVADVAGYLRGQVVMVTGGGGSIGSELCRQIARFQPSQLIIFDIYENNAYQLQQELIGQYKHSLKLEVLIGSVRDVARLEQVIRQYQPAIIFHAAAHKHVPLMQDSPGEAVKNNIIGTYNTATTAARNNVKRFVLISTDKAVNPTNAMGASKRMAELTLQYLSRLYPLTTFAAVRFGNVLGSSGSVIPLFKQQIQQQRRVTVTDPDITRYFMTIPEAARLVIQAGALARGGEIFVLDMGQPVKIVDLARDLIRLSGLEPDVDVEIVYTGLRPGEKMFEEISLDQEKMDQTRHEKIFVMKPIQDAASLKSEIEKLQSIIGWTSQAFRELSDQIQETLVEVVEQKASLKSSAVLPQVPPVMAEQTDSRNVPF
jgi:FlaA1/EpsC-like NDP-sugar epimerase